MKNDFLLAIAQLAGEKNLSKEVVFEAVETALASAYRKDQAQSGPVVVKIDQNTGTAHFYAQKTVVTDVEDDKAEMTLKEARGYQPRVGYRRHDQHRNRRPARRADRRPDGQAGRAAKAAGG